MVRGREDRPDRDARASGPGLVRSLNLQAVLDVLLDAGHDEGLTRPAFAERTGISLPTVSSLVGDLESLGLIEERGIVSGSLGRPAQVYGLVPDAGHVVALSLDGETVDAGVADLRGTTRARRTVRIEQERPDGLLARLGRLTDELVAEADLAPASVGVLTLGVPGVWRPADDSVTDVPSVPALAALHPRTDLARRTGYHVVVENDVNLAALGERRRGAARDIDDFVVISVGSGAGMGVVIGGELFRGHSGAAGELALLPIGANPYDPTYRNAGAFEAAAAGGGLSRRLHEALARGEATELESDAGPVEVLTAAALGDALALRLLDEEARTLALGVAAAVAMLDPQLVVLGGRVGSDARLAAAVARYASRLLPRGPALVPSALGVAAPFEGAVAAGLDALRPDLIERSDRVVRRTTATGAGQEQGGSDG